MHQVIINGTSEADCRRLLTEAKARYGIKSANSGNRSLKKNFDNEFLDTPCDTRNSNVLIPGSGSRTLKFAGDSRDSSDLSEFHGEKMSGLDDTPLALIIDGNSLVYILEKDLETEV